MLTNLSQALLLCLCNLSQGGMVAHPETNVYTFNTYKAIICMFSPRALYPIPNRLSITTKFE